MRGGLEAAQVGLELARQHVQGRALASAVAAEHAQDLARSRHREAVQLEGVVAILMRDVGV
eukprot:CAMPEP_0197904576 /NCGR_PEP_ID=MMETSP1439-20131203/58363_1 /TAXON_ID=66791 /ORGANISM="Gonyaulax spinifera, Strain CCMP409" /LENGTH=60 /DNA_ID=CAMNT_0043525783 /DNA_START=54 /DNA_END=237 /DNA_ORIENTATION=+